MAGVLIKVIAQFLLPIVKMVNSWPRWLHRYGNGLDGTEIDTAMKTTSLAIRVLHKLTVHLGRNRIPNVATFGNSSNFAVLYR